MGLTYANLKLTNLFNQASIEVNALIDCGATFMYIPESATAQLGFDTTEVSQQLVTLANGHQVKVPKVAPVKIEYANRSYVTEALVMGDEALMGVLPLEAMDLVIHPGTQTLSVNPEHPNFPVALAK